MASLDTKMSLTLKDLIFIITVLGGMFGGYYAVTGEIALLKNKVMVLEEANKAYIGLPEDVKQIKIGMKEHGKIVNFIYLGLIDKDIIDPPGQ